MPAFRCICLVVASMKQTLKIKSWPKYCILRAIVSDQVTLLFLSLSLSLCLLPCCQSINKKEGDTMPTHSLYRRTSYSLQSYRSMCLPVCAYVCAFSTGHFCVERKFEMQQTKIIDMEEISASSPSQLSSSKLN